ncbi:MAG: oligosaccharide flippase family protein [Hyphomicrobiales bacterium]|nr:oligosaccharide flippase family protein [Hyphomicrobiales bacterium]
MLLAATFAINSCLNFILGLLIARFLGPEQFGLYALGSALLVLVNAFGIDWLKLSTIRFYQQSKRASEPAIRATLDGMAALCSLALAVPLLVAIIAGIDLSIPTAIAAAAVAAGIVGGLFDYQQAVARAREDDAIYARMVVVKNVLAFSLMAGGAWWTRDPAMVLLGSAVSSLAALSLVRKALSDAPLALGSIDRGQVKVFATYAFPLVLTNVLLSSIPLLNRAYMASAHGLAEAGYFALASDIGVKLMGTLGATVEIMLLPLAVRAFETGGQAAAQERIKHNLLIVLAIILPVATGFLLILPAFEALVVPETFRGHFSQYVWLLMPGLLAMPIMQVGFNPVFLVERRTLVSTVSASLAVALNGALLGLVALGVGGSSGRSPQAVAVAMSAGFVAAALLVAGSATLRAHILPTGREALTVCCALIAMGLALWPLRAFGGTALTLALQVFLGVTIYGAVLLAGNLGGCRAALRDYVRKPRQKKAPA